MLDIATVSQIGRAAGLTSLGVSPVTVGEKYCRALANYIHQGYYGEMVYLKRWLDYNSVIRKQLPWARTVIVGLDNYYQTAPWRADYPRWSRYAWGEDYHLIVKAKMRRLRQHLQQLAPNLRGKIYVDSGPVLAKALAEQAGLGWIGSNCLLIAKGIGTYCFIGLLYIDQEVDQPATLLQESCGACRLCLEACPTGALLAPGVLDARRCTAYLTIEKQSALTTEEKSLIKGWLYGCDRCQEVCPRNRQWAQPSPDERYRRLLPELCRPLATWEKLDSADFERLFAKSAIRRLGLPRLRRNLKAQY